MRLREKNEGTFDHLQGQRLSPRVPDPDKPKDVPWKASGLQ